jgi:hypothetical protein
METKYVIDSTEKFAGYCITVLRDGKDMYSGGTLEDVRKEHNNPNLIAIDEEEMRNLFVEYINEINQSPYVEIDEERFDELYNCLPPKRYNKVGDVTMFFVGEPFTYDVYPFCFSFDGRYFSSHRRIGMSWDALYADAMHHYRNLISNVTSR